MTSGRLKELICRIRWFFPEARFLPHNPYAGVSQIRVTCARAIDCWISFFANDGHLKDRACALPENWCNPQRALQKRVFCYIILMRTRNWTFFSCAGNWTVFFWSAFSWMGCNPEEFFTSFDWLQVIALRDARAQERLFWKEARSNCNGWIWKDHQILINRHIKTIRQNNIS